MGSVEVIQLVSGCPDSTRYFFKHRYEWKKSKLLTVVAEILLKVTVPFPSPSSTHTWPSGPSPSPTRRVRVCPSLSQVFTCDFGSMLNSCPTATALPTDLCGRERGVWCRGSEEERTVRDRHEDICCRKQCGLSFLELLLHCSFLTQCV